ncbi:MAG: four helix bundle protein [Patescibacteria group bacterium]
MKINSHKDLLVWQKSMELLKGIYTITKKLPAEELYNLTSQVRRACISVPSNIAEGYRRGTLGEYKQFLGIASGSASEVETQLLLIKSLYPNIYIEDELTEIQNIQKMLMSLSKKLRPTA